MAISKKERKRLQNLNNFYFNLFDRRSRNYTKQVNHLYKNFFDEVLYFYVTDYLQDEDEFYLVLNFKSLRLLKKNIVKRRKINRIIKETDKFLERTRGERLESLKKESDKAFKNLKKVRKKNGDDFFELSKEEKKILGKSKDFNKLLAENKKKKLSKALLNKTKLRKIDATTKRQFKRYLKKDTTIKQSFKKIRKDFLKFNGIRNNKTAIHEMAVRHSIEEDSYAEVLNKIFKSSGSKRTMFKTWISQRDNRVRDSHALLDSIEIKKIRKFTSFRGFKIMFPRDTFAHISETIGCRCFLRYRTKLVRKKKKSRKRRT